MKNFLFPFVFFFTAIGCSNNNQNDKSGFSKTAPEQKMAVSDSNVIKVYVDETGVITANGNSISLEGLDSSFNKLKINNGIVYYSRANGQGEPPRESMKVIELVVKYSLPIKLYTDKTFSVLVKPN